jgi:L-ascorbate metabolism protein UlaG (beta-lactamase superfamily)
VLRRLLSLATVLAVAACADSNPYYDPSKPHHRPDGFTNVYLDNKAIGGGFLRWQWERVWFGLPKQNPGRVPRKTPDLAYLKANRSDATVTWIGHATSLWQVGGLNILTDPHFTDRASPLPFVGSRRATDPAIALADLPRIDVVVLTHNHYDHLDRPSVAALNKQPGGPPVFIVPLGVDLWLKREGIANVRPLDWWQSTAVGAATVTLTPVQHWSSRTPFDRHATLWGGFVVEAGGLSLFHTGDAGYSKDFADIQNRFGGFNFAQLPVGCYEPRWFMKGQHVNEEEAVRAHLDLRSRLTLGIHWGAFRLCDEPVEQPMDRLPVARKALGVPDDAFILFAIGETRVLRRAP